MKNKAEQYIQELIEQKIYEMLWKQFHEKLRDLEGKFQDKILDASKIAAQEVLKDLKDKIK